MLRLEIGAAKRVNFEDLVLSEYFESQYEIFRVAFHISFVDFVKILSTLDMLVGSYGCKCN